MPNENGKRTIKVQAGAATRNMEIPDGVKTVGDLRKKLDRLGVTGDHTAYVRTSGAGSASAIGDEAAIEDGMSLEFTRTTGQKG